MHDYPSSREISASIKNESEEQKIHSNSTVVYALQPSSKTNKDVNFTPHPIHPHLQLNKGVIFEQLHIETQNSEIDLIIKGTKKIIRFGYTTK